MNNTFSDKLKSLFTSKTFYRFLPLIFIFILFFFFAFYDQSSYYAEENANCSELLTISAFLLSGAAVFVLYYKQKLTYDNIIMLLLICGFVLRLSYAIKYHYSVNQHDVENLESNGHLAYIYSIYNGGLPDHNDWQFSHPPLHHLLAALSMHISEAFGFTVGRAFENIQLLSVLYSTLTMLAGYKIFKLLNLKDKYLVLCVALLCFHPTFFILAGSINNDILTIMLSTFAILFILKWWGNPSIKYALLCGFCCGAAMMTKVSAALIVLIIAISVLIRFFIDKSFKFRHLVLQIVSFLIVLIPLGFWHPIRNYVLFCQPFGYVAPIPVTSALYTGDISVFKRILLPFSLDGFGVYTDVWNEYNLWQYLLRNSLFGEYNFGNEGIAIILVLANLILIVLSLVAVVFLLLKRNAIKGTIIPLFILFLVELAFFVYFNIAYPFGCSMDFRYIVPVLLSGFAFIGMFLSRLSLNYNRFFIVLEKASVFTVITFCVLSTIIMF
ncbi:MAG: glycosyltransferase family 39 protein [Clostridia bacterium]|nr:glycosyltransferase family 39 protein [Clostridia bacterium]